MIKLLHTESIASTTTAAGYVHYLKRSFLRSIIFDALVQLATSWSFQHISHICMYSEN
jgi:hypothetical protein